jgi:hypothetical protein
MVDDLGLWLGSASVLAAELTRTILRAGHDSRCPRADPTGKI